MLFRAVQNGLCTMAEKKSSPGKNEVPAHCPTCPPVSGVERAELGRGDGTIDKATAKKTVPRDIAAMLHITLCNEKSDAWDRTSVNSRVSSRALNFSSTCFSSAAVSIFGALPSEPAQGPSGKWGQCSC